MNLRDRVLWHLFKINLSNTDDRNAWYLVVEMFWSSILGSVATFNAAYAIRLGADNFQVSLISSIPALIAVLVSIPAGQFLERRPRRTPWVFGALFSHRAGYVLVALAPLLHLTGVSQGMLVVLILVLISAPAHFFNIGWIPLLAEVIPENRRAAVFAARNIINQVTVSIVGFLCGLWLSEVKFPINYQAVYLVGFAASMLSQFNLVKMKVPDSPARSDALEKPKRQSLRDSIRMMREAMTEQPAFMRITRNTLLHGVGVWMAGPLYTLYYVRVLDAPESWLGLNGTIASIGTIIGFSLWRWLLSRWGEPVCLKRTICLIGLYPLMVGLTPSLPLILIISAINGLIVPGVNLSHFNLLLKVTPADARPSYTALYQTIMNLGAFISPMISIVLAEVIGLNLMLVIAGLLSVIGSASFLWWPVIKPSHAEPEQTPQAA